MVGVLVSTQAEYLHGQQAPSVSSITNLFLKEYLTEY